MIAKALQRLAVPVESLTPHPRNARRGDVEGIKASLERFGRVKPIIVQKSTGYVVAGNHVLASVVALGWSKVARIAVEMSDEQALAYLVADNRLADLGGYDEQGMADLLADLSEFSEGLEGTGYDADSYSSLLANLQGAWNEADTQAEWRGMPEFAQADETSVQRIIVHFATREDVAKFGKLVKQNLSEKTRAIWFPEAEIGRIADKAYE